MIAPQDALERLRAGNARFVQGAPNPSPQSRLDTLGPQRPFAAVLGCSDSRCPVEAIFDQGFGELFVVRVAGNVADVTQVGSLEFAVQALGVRLILVLGHQNCGAVQAALQRPADLPSALGSLVDLIEPALDSLQPDPGAEPSDILLANAVAANARHTADALRAGSPLIDQEVAGGRVAIASAVYAFDTGIVTFLDEGV
ncbi:MAG: carbonic anhydrase [Gammaproteobacteria bacterium]|nr:carbonic anhydrase [Gammaproteobacteria bacterium]